MNIDEFCSELQHRQLEQRPLIVGISGFGGAGKSTAAGRLANRLTGAVVVSADDFIIDQQSERSDSWTSIDRARIIEQLLGPLHDSGNSTYQVYDWPNNELGEWRTIEHASYVLLEGVGVIHPDLLPYLHVTTWLDVPQDVANERGKTRDREIYQVDHDALWDTLWSPNDRDAFERFRPDRLADYILDV